MSRAAIICVLVCSYITHAESPIMYADMCLQQLLHDAHHKQQLACFTLHSPHHTLRNYAEALLLLACAGLCLCSAGA
jgi:hypothetical protein